MFEKKLSILIVAYNDNNYLEKCISSIYENFSNFLTWEIIIINNNEISDINNIFNLTTDSSKIKLINHKKNIGFGAGINLGATEALGEYLLILNSDTKILGKNIKHIFDEFSKDKNIGVIGAGIINKQGLSQAWSAGKKLTLHDLIRNNLGLSRSKSIWKNSKKIECDWVAGTAMFIQKDLFDKLGGFDKRFFMYFEDMDLCLRVRKLGKKVMFFPEFQIFHGSGESYKDKRLQKKHYYNSLEQYFQKNCTLFSQMVVKISRRLIIRK